jgi:hypothetical protein
MSNWKFFKKKNKTTNCERAAPALRPRSGPPTRHPPRLPPRLPPRHRRHLHRPPRPNWWDPTALAKLHFSTTSQRVSFEDAAIARRGTYALSRQNAPKGVGNVDLHQKVRVGATPRPRSVFVGLGGRTTTLGLGRGRVLLAS